MRCVKTSVIVLQCNRTVLMLAAESILLKMKPSKGTLLQSKIKAKILLVRHANAAATLKKQERLFQREWNSDLKLLLKQRENILQRQLSLAGELSPRLGARKKKVDHDNRVSSPSKPFPFLFLQSPSPITKGKIKPSRSNPFARSVGSNSVAVSLPPISVTMCDQQLSLARSRKKSVSALIHSVSLPGNATKGKTVAKKLNGERKLQKEK